MEAIADKDYKALYEASQNEIAYLKQELAKLKQLIFGTKTERFVPDNGPQQGTLGFNAEEINAVKITSAQKIEYTRVKTESAKKDHPGRYPLPEHLERREHVIEPENITEGSKKIGEEVTEELEYEPGKLFVNKYIRPKYAKPDNSGVVVAPMVDRPLPKSIAGAGLLTQIVIDKYADHLPLYRQAERFKREGVNIPYSTITDWVSGAVNLITPIYEALRQEVLQTTYLHVDESPIKVLDKNKKGETHRGYYWVYHNSIERMVLFDYREGRGREGPLEMLEGFKGHLQTDGYNVYDHFKNRDEITHLHCMAHARRKFYESLQNDQARAAYALEQMGLLYATERKAKEKGLDAAEVYELRQKEAVPVIEQLGKWMVKEYAKVLPKSSIGQALAYSIQRWKELAAYTTDGKLNIDNNPVENSIRPMAIGRRNYLFAGSHEAAQRSAILYSLIGTCKINEINPFAYLKYVLQNIAKQPINKIKELLPQNYAANQPG